MYPTYENLTKIERHLGNCLMTELATTWRFLLEAPEDTAIQRVHKKWWISYSRDFSRANAPAMTHKPINHDFLKHESLLAKRSNVFKKQGSSSTRCSKTYSGMKLYHPSKSSVDMLQCYLCASNTNLIILKELCVGIIIL